MSKQNNQSKDSTKQSEESTLKQSSQSAANSSDNSKNIIPDEVPRKDGPGGE